jgi:hypothetical protein
MIDLESVKKDIPYNELDQNIAGLVKALNEFPGLVTIQSCGGHDRLEEGLNQAPKGFWYVTLYAGDLRDLATIAFAARPFGQAILIEAFYDYYQEDFDPSYLLFALKGRDIEPGKFAEVLQAAPGESL